MEIFCLFGNYKFQDGREYYSCIIDNQQIPENIELTFTGEHLSEKTHNDVSKVWFSTCTLTRVPQHLTKSFPNMTILSVTNSGLQNICKSDVTEYKKLKIFICDENEIEFLPGDLFKGFENLEWISFARNDMSIIEPNILNGLSELKFVDFSGNTKVMAECPIYTEFECSNLTLQKFKDELLQKFLKSDIEFVKNYFAKFENRIQELENHEEYLINGIETMLSIQNDACVPVQEVQVSNQQNEELLVTDLKKYIKNDNSKDFKIIINEEEFRIHKFLLSARSPAFADILQKYPAVNTLNLASVSAEVFKIINEFIYEDKFPQEADIDYLKLFIAAGRFKIEDLKNYAGMKVIDLVNGENCFEMFNLGHKYGHSVLRQKSFNEIKIKYPKVELDMEPDDLVRIIKLFGENNVEKVIKGTENIENCNEKVT